MMMPVVGVCTRCGRKFVALGTKTRYGRYFDPYLFRGEPCGGAIRLIVTTEALSPADKENDDG